MNHSLYGLIIRLFSLWRCWKSKKQPWQYSIRIISSKPPPPWDMALYEKSKKSTIHSCPDNWRYKYRNVRITLIVPTYMNLSLLNKFIQWSLVRTRDSFQDQLGETVSRADEIDMRKTPCCWSNKKELRICHLYNNTPSAKNFSTTSMLPFTETTVPGRRVPCGCSSWSCCAAASEEWVEEAKLRGLSPKLLKWEEGERCCCWYCCCCCCCSSRWYEEVPRWLRDLCNPDSWSRL